MTLILRQVVKHTRCFSTLPPHCKTIGAIDSTLTRKAIKKSLTATDLSLPNNTIFPSPLVIDDADKEQHNRCLTIASYNVAGLKACIRKGFHQYVQAEDPDILCLQETKLNAPLANAVDETIYKYRYWAFDEKKGYGGVAVFSKHRPTHVHYGLPDYRGRVLSVTFGSAFTLLCCYSPNAGASLARLDTKQHFNAQMEHHIRALQHQGESVIWAGDLNVAHTPADLARPSTNTRSAGFTMEERTDMTRMLGSLGLIDTWRHLHPTTQGHYTYFGYRFRCREKRLGWRLDYFCLTPDLLPKLINSVIRHQVWGASDHVPIVLLLKDISLE